MWKCNPADVEMIWNMSGIKAGESKIEGGKVRMIITIITRTLNHM